MGHGEKWTEFIAEENVLGHLVLIAGVKRAFSEGSLSIKRKQGLPERGA